MPKHSCRKLQWLDIPEWRGGIWLRPLTAGERHEYERELTRIHRGGTFNLIDARMLLVVLSVCNAKGKRLFSRKDAAWLRERGAVPVARICNAAARLNRLHKSDHEALVVEMTPARRF